MSLEDFELFFSDRKTAAKAFAVFDLDGDNHVTRREVRAPAAPTTVCSLSFHTFCTLAARWANTLCIPRGKVRPLLPLHLPAVHTFSHKPHLSSNPSRAVQPPS